MDKWECDDNIHISLYEMCGSWMERCPVCDGLLKDLAKDNDTKDRI